MMSKNMKNLSLLAKMNTHQKLVYTYLLLKNPNNKPASEIFNDIIQWVNIQSDGVEHEVQPKIQYHEVTSIIQMFLKNDILEAPNMKHTFNVSKKYNITEPNQTIPLSNIKEIFEHWKITSHHQQAKLDVKRKKKIKDAFQMGYSIDELKQAISGCGLSPWHNGDNPNQREYNSIDLIFRNADKIDQFIKIDTQGVTETGKGALREKRNKNTVSQWLENHG